MIVIIDLNLGNVGAIKNMLKKIGVHSKVSNKKNDILSATKLILPGVGSFDTGMINIKKKGILNCIEKKVKKEFIPILGICLGMQMMMQRSDEGKQKGLGWIKGEVKKFRLNELKVPHMGWNKINVVKETKITDKLDLNSKFYFVHSYYVSVNNPDDIVSLSKYGLEFTSAINHKNYYGVQFHPEKSHKFGMALLSNFSRI